MITEGTKTETTRRGVSNEKTYNQKYVWAAIMLISIISLVWLGKATLTGKKKSK